MPGGGIRTPTNPNTSPHKCEFPLRLMERLYVKNACFDSRVLLAKCTLAIGSIIATPSGLHIDNNLPVATWYSVLHRLL